MTLLIGHCREGDAVLDDEPTRETERFEQRWHASFSAGTNLGAAWRSTAVVVEGRARLELNRSTVGGSSLSAGCRCLAKWTRELVVC